jgi:putative ABC transport system permease protein
VLTSCVIAFPIAGLISHNWLKSYAYRTNISWVVFMMAGAGALVVALMTVSFITIRASLANPIKSLRTE